MVTAESQAGNGTHIKVKYCLLTTGDEEAECPDNTTAVDHYFDKSGAYSATAPSTWQSTITGTISEISSFYEGASGDDTATKAKNYWTATLPTVSAK